MTVKIACVVFDRADALAAGRSIRRRRASSPASDLTFIIKSEFGGL